MEKISPHLTVTTLPTLSLRKTNPYPPPPSKAPVTTGPFAASFKHINLPHSTPIEHALHGWTGLPEVIDSKKTQIIGVLTCKGGLPPELPKLKISTKPQSKHILFITPTPAAATPSTAQTKKRPQNREHARVELLKRAYEFGSNKTPHPTSHHWTEAGALKGTWTSGDGWKLVKEELKAARNVMSTPPELQSLGIPSKLLESNHEKKLYPLPHASSSVAFKAVIQSLTRGRRGTKQDTPKQLHSTTSLTHTISEDLKAQRDLWSRHPRFRWKLAIHLVLQHLSNRKNHLYPSHHHTSNGNIRSNIQYFDRMAQFLDAPLAFNVYPPKECTRRLKAQGHNDVDIINREKEAFMWAMQIKALIDKRGEHGTFKTFRDVSQLDFLMREVPWFAQLNEDVRHGLCDHIQVHVVPRNKTLVRETHRHSRWYILLTGSVNKINQPPSKVLQRSSQRSHQTVQTISINPTSTSLPHETADLDQEQQQTLPSITLYQSVTKHCPHVTSSHTISHSIPGLTTTPITESGTSLTPFQNLLDPLAYTQQYPCTLKTATTSIFLSISRSKFIQIVQDASSSPDLMQRPLLRVAKLLSKTSGFLDYSEQRDWVMEVARKGRFMKVESMSLFPDTCMKGAEWVVVKGGAVVQVVAEAKSANRVVKCGGISVTKPTKRIVKEIELKKMMWYGTGTNWELEDCKYNREQETLFLRLAAGKYGCLAFFYHQ